jgi:hypothetical protein
MSTFSLWDLISENVKAAMFLMLHYEICSYENCSYQYAYVLSSYKIPDT